MGGLKSKVWKRVKPQLIKQLQSLSKGIPQTDLEVKHVKNTKLLPNRSMLLDLLPKNAVAAELGVDFGGFSELILKQCQPKKLHLIDFWGSSRYNVDKKNHVFEKFDKQRSEGQIEINLGLSTVVVDQFEDSYFDWIYIDTDHTYQTTKDELERYAPKIKPGGIMAGHDYISVNPNSWARNGVVEAVHEFCVKENWELIYITNELTDCPSFAIKKI